MARKLNNPLPVEKSDPRLGVKNGFYRFETDDCTVRALTHFLSIDYDTAWKFCTWLGRVPCKRFTSSKIMATLNAKQETRFHGMTLNQAMKVLSFLKKDRFYIVIRKHALAIVNGKIQDSFDPPNGKIQQCWVFRKETN